MALRKAVSYSKRKNRPYTRRSKKRSKSYIKTIPQQKIVKFDMGKIKEFNTGKYSIVMRLVSKENVLLRDNALEACRKFIHRDLEKQLAGAYYLSIRKYPHHILRENRMYSGGSKGERVNTGMKQSFGTAIGRGAFIKTGEAILLIAFAEKKFIPIVRKDLDKIRPKLACKTKVIVEEKND